MSNSLGGGSRTRLSNQTSACPKSAARLGGILGVSTPQTPKLIAGGHAGNNIRSFGRVEDIMNLALAQLSEPHTHSPPITTSISRMATNSISNLSARISAHAGTLSSFYGERNLAPPSLTDPSSPLNPLPRDAPEDILNARRDILEATRKLETTLLGPSDALRILIHGVSSLFPFLAKDQTDE